MFICEIWGKFTLFIFLKFIPNFPHKHVIASTNLERIEVVPRVCSEKWLIKGSSPNFPSNLGELINFCSPRTHQKTYGLLIISRGIEVNPLSANPTKWSNTLK